MAEEFTTTKLNHESHLLLDQPLLRLPHELTRKNFKTVQRHVERENKDVVALLKSTANACLAKKDTDQTLRSLDSMIRRMKGLKRKMETIHGEERTYQEASRRRLRHLQDLYDIPGLADVKYDQWSKVRLDRLLVEYLARHGFSESAKMLAQEKGIEQLVDLEAHARCYHISQRLRGGSLEECLAWCADHRVMMRKIEDNRLDFELRLQQYVELCRGEKRAEALEYARKHIISQWESDTKKILKSSILLVTSSTQKISEGWYSQSRWDELADLFNETHNQLFSIPSRPLLLIALSAGLSSLKTPSCHSEFASSTANASSTTTSVCPICSTELNELARRFPYAHHTKSYVENDPVVLPNGRVYGRERLLEMSAKVGINAGLVKDPTTSEVYEAEQVRKVYIS